MKCFIHIYDEAVAVCKRCGKAMCGNCSAYTNHSGICPECKRDDFIAERNSLLNSLAETRKSMRANIAGAVIFAVLALALCFISLFTLILLVVALIFFIRIFIIKSRRVPIETRINYLNGEINKLNTALERNRAEI